LKKIDENVKKETLNITVWTLILSLLMQAIFLIIGQWNYAVLLGNLLGIFIGCGNFLLMGIGIQRALEKDDEKKAKTAMLISQRLRTLGILVLAALGAALPCFNIWATLVPIFFPSLCVLVRPLLTKKEESNDEKE